MASKVNLGDKVEYVGDRKVLQGTTGTVIGRSDGVYLVDAKGGDFDATANELKRRK